MKLSLYGQLQEYFKGQNILQVMSMMEVMKIPLKYEPRHDKTNNVAVRPSKTQISLI